MPAGKRERPRSPSPEAKYHDTAGAWYHLKISVASLMQIMITIGVKYLAWGAQMLTEGEDHDTTESDEGTNKGRADEDDEALDRKRRKLDTGVTQEGSADATGSGDAERDEARGENPSQENTEVTKEASADETGSGGAKRDGKQDTAGGGVEGAGKKNTAGGGVEGIGVKDAGASPSVVVLSMQALFRIWLKTYCEKYKQDAIDRDFFDADEIKLCVNRKSKFALITKHNSNPDPAQRFHLIDLTNTGGDLHVKIHAPTAMPDEFDKEWRSTVRNVERGLTNQKICDIFSKAIDR